MAESNVKAEKNITYDAIKIGLASPEKIREIIPRGGKETGNNQL